MKLVPLINSKETAKVDDEDFDWIMKWKWMHDKELNYAYREKIDDDGDVIIIFMHNAIWNRHHPNPNIN